jgi:hypothetical protein
MNFSYQSGTILDVDLAKARIWATKALDGGRVYLTLDVKVVQRPNIHSKDGPYSVSNIHGKLEWNNQLVAYVHSSNANNFNTLHPSDGQLQLEFFISNRQLQVIEERRQGQIIQFNLSLQCEIFGWRPLGDKKEISDIYSVEKFSNINVSTFTTEILSVLESDWLKILADSGYGENLNVNLLFRNETSKPEFIKAIRKLQEAQNQLWKGCFQNCVEDCRQALEILKPHFAETSKEAGKKDLKKLNKLERSALLAIRLWELSSLAHHGDEIGQATNWDREDATTALLMTTALVKWLEHSRAK